MSKLIIRVVLSFIAKPYLIDRLTLTSMRTAVKLGILVIIFQIWFLFILETRFPDDSNKSRYVSLHPPYNSTKTKSEGKCARNKGVIVVDLLGLLGNSIFEVGFANRMSKELCWNVIYRNSWISPFLKERSRTCFPKALLEYQEEPAFNLIGEPNTKEDEELWGLLQKKRISMNCFHRKCDFTETGLQEMIKNVSSASSKIRFLHLKAFFIHGGWLRDIKWQNKMKKEFEMNPSCCSVYPPENAVVIHIRDFESEKQQKHNHYTRSIQSSVYKHIIEKYNHVDKPVWVVCQPKSVDSKQVKELQSMFNHVEIHTGQDEYDAICILKRASILIASYGSTFSQAAALIGSNKEVHLPIVDQVPDTTIGLPSWKFHFVNKEKDGVKDFDVPYDHFDWAMY